MSICSSASCNLKVVGHQIIRYRGVWAEQCIVLWAGSLWSPSYTSFLVHSDTLSLVIPRALSLSTPPSVGEGRAQIFLFQLRPLGRQLGRTKREDTVYVNIMERKYYGTGPFLAGPFHNIYVPKYLQGQLGTRW